MEFDFFSKKYFVTRFFSYMQYETKAYNFLKLRDAGDYVKDFLKVSFLPSQPFCIAVAFKVAIRTGIKGGQVTIPSHGLFR